MWTACDYASTLLLVLVAATVEGSCNINATKCGDCVSAGHTSCYWCPSSHLKNGGGSNSTNGTVQQCFSASAQDHCPECDSIDNCKTNTCLLSAKTLYIIIGATAGGVILLLSIWIYCCCNKRAKKRLNTYLYKESKKSAKARKAREERQESRRAERAEKTDAIRAKYGLSTQKNDIDDDDTLLDNDDMGMRW
eukprot:m.119504 g.119504  ORF g.119504 m.119504 type:complete len:193 (+) comp17242_c0_seq1:119-697(+)